MLHHRKQHLEPSHKLEIFKVGEKTYSDLAALAGNVVDGDTSLLEFMRIDLCCDIPNVPVSWFHDNCRFRYKRRHQQIGTLKVSIIAGIEMETLMFGARPNPVRIYDKVELWRKQFRTDCRRQSRENDPLDFEHEYGLSPNSTLTRIERQYGGGRLPRELPNFGSLARAADIEPFTALEIPGGTFIAPRIDDYEFGEWLKGMRLRQEATERGAHNFRRWLNLHSNGNAARWMRNYAAFLPGAALSGPTQADILKAYKESTIFQLAA